MTGRPSTVLTTQYAVLKTQRRSRTALLSGMPSVVTDDTEMRDLALSVGETQTFASKNYLLVELGQPLEVTVSLPQPSGPPVTFTADLAGLIALPCAAQVTVSNPARFGYTLDIAVRAVTG